jgi:hypothetical protein
LIYTALCKFAKPLCKLAKQVVAATAVETGAYPGSLQVCKEALQIYMVFFKLSPPPCRLQKVQSSKSLCEIY